MYEAKEDSPGTSSVSLSFRMPKLHFVGACLASPSSSEEVWAEVSCWALDRVGSQRTMVAEGCGRRGEVRWTRV